MLDIYLLSVKSAIYPTAIKKVVNPLEFITDDKDTGYTARRNTAKVMSQPEFGVLYLPRPALLLKLLILLIHHPYPGSPNRMTEAL